MRLIRAPSTAAIERDYQRSTSELFLIVPRFIRNGLRGPPELTGLFFPSTLSGRSKPVTRLIEVLPAAMDPSASFNVLALGFTLLLIPSWEWLSKTSAVVPAPYLVSFNFTRLKNHIFIYCVIRMRFSTLARHRYTALAISLTGIPKLPLHQACRLLLLVQK